MSDCEPLREKVKKDMITYKSVYRYYFDKDDVASAVRFYKKYSYNPMLLKKEEKGIYKKYTKNSFKVCVSEIDIITYNDWLFDYTFKDVINNIEQQIRNNEECDFSLTEKKPKK